MGHNFKKVKLTLRIIMAVAAFALVSAARLPVIGTTVTVHASYRYSYGSKGEMVKIIQTKLKNFGYYSAKIDGCFGLATLSAVKNFQRDNGLEVDGVAGSKTLSALNQTGGAEAVPAAAMSDDYETAVWLLACVINGEGRGESYEGQVAIGAVVLNRVSSPFFPDSIADVIFQPGQFSAVKDGQINLEPSESCLMAARDALSGKDPVSGALYFWNPITSTSKWIQNLTVTKRIGNHVFGMH